MEARAVRGVSWTMLGYVANRSLTLATTIVLARQLSPDDFGLMSLAIVFVTASTLLGAAGFHNAFVVRQDLDEVGRGTIFTVVLLVGALAGVVMVALAPFLAGVFGEPDLRDVLFALSVTVLLGGVTGFYEAVLQRELEFARQFVARLVQSVLFSVVGISLAFAGAGVWSLVLAQIVSWLGFTLLMVVLAPYRARVVLSGRAVRDVWPSARGFLAQGTSAFVSNNADYFAVGSGAGLRQLGFYSMAYRLTDITYWAVVEPVSKVTFPGFARMRHRGDDTRAAFASVLRTVSLVACPAGVILSGTSDPFTRTVFGESWVPMIGALAVLGIWAAVRPLSTTLGWYLLSIGQAGVVGLVSVCLLAPLVVGVLVAAEYGGIVAVSWVMLTLAVVDALIMAAVAVRRRETSTGDLWGAVRPVVIGCAGAWAAAWGTTEATVGLAHPVRLLLGVAAGFLAYVLVVSAVDRRAIGDALRRARQVVSSPAPR